jgi:hypothetical protein
VRGCSEGKRCSSECGEGEAKMSSVSGHVLGESGRRLA